MSDEQQSFFVEDALKLEERLTRIESHLLQVEAALDALKNEHRVSFAIGDSHNKLN